MRCPSTIFADETPRNHEAWNITSRESEREGGEDTKAGGEMEREG